MNRAGASLAIALGIAAGAAHATVYNFNVLYTGGGHATLAAGSDDMLGITAMSGDTFNYSISANGHWTTIAPGGPFLFGAIGDLDGNFGPVSFTESYSFDLGGVTQLAGSGSDTQGGADLGLRRVSFPQGMSFDTFSESIVVTSATQSLNFYSLLPAWPGKAPEIEAPAYFTYTAAPEPAAWAMMLIGFGGLGAAMRARRRIVSGPA